MQIAELILRYLQVLLTWPAVALVLGVLALRWFREPIADFLRRMVRGEGYGVRLEATDQSQQRKEAQETKETIQPQSQDSLEKYIRDNPQEMVKQYIRLYNGYWFERAYNLIYGTQLDLLEHLATWGDTGEKYVNLVLYYNEFVKRSSLQSTQMADYLGFLRDMNFLEYVVEGNEQRARITPLGVDFLSYIKTQYSVGYKYKAF